VFSTNGTKAQLVLEQPFTVSDCLWHVMEERKHTQLQQQQQQQQQQKQQCKPDFE